MVITDLLPRNARLYGDEVYAPLPQALQEIIDHENDQGEKQSPPVAQQAHKSMSRSARNTRPLWRAQQHIDTRLAAKLINDRPSRCIMSASGEMKPLISKAGKVYGFLEAEGADKSLFKVQ